MKMFNNANTKRIFTRFLRRHPTFAQYREKAVPWYQHEPKAFDSVSVREKYDDQVEHQNRQQGELACVQAIG